MADLFLSKKLKEERKPIADKIRQMRDTLNARPEAERVFSAEEDEQWKKVNADYDAFEPRIRAAEINERAEFVDSDRPADREPPPGHEDRTNKDREEDEERSEDRRKPQVTEQHRSLALQAWCRRQLNDDAELTEEHLNACKLTGWNPNRRELVIDLRKDYRRMRAELMHGEQRALSINTDTAGAYTIPDGFIPNLEKALLWFGGMRQVARIMRTTGGELISMPTANDTGNVGARIQENTAVSEQDITFGAIQLRAHKYTSRLVRVPVELLQDSAFDIASELGTMLGERIGRIQNTEFTTGTGNTMPLGIAQAAAAGVTAAGASDITADEIIGMVHALDPAYRAQGPGWMMRDSTVRYVRRLKDGFGNYLWQPGLVAGVPDMLLGYRITINSDIAAIATGARTILFGLFSKYIIRDVAEIRMRRLVERYADSDQEGFVAFVRSDGNLLDAGGSPVVRLTQA